MIAFLRLRGIRSEAPSGAPVDAARVLLELGGGVYVRAGRSSRSSSPPVMLAGAEELRAARAMQDTLFIPLTVYEFLLHRKGSRGHPGDPLIRA